MSEADRAREILKAGSYMTLATADADGRPWASPVWFAPEMPGSPASLLWLSRTEARHSANVAVRPEVSIVIFDSHAPISTGVGLYLDATAAEVPADELGRPLAAYSAHSVERGGAAFEPADATADAPHRLFRATADAGWLGERDQRTPIELG